jgi:endonuclease/exonuclease/phosphatase family metal-dependent hydrolase
MKKLIRSTLMLLSLVAALPAQEPEPDFTVATFNVFNWGPANRTIEGVYLRDAMKPESEKKAAVKIIKELNADVLVIQEIILNNADANIEDIRNHIAASGLNYPYAVFSTGEDTRIGLLLLSRLPFIESYVLNEDDFTLKNSSGIRTTRRVSRGIAHAAVEPVPGKRIDILGVHFKSRLAKSEFDDPDTGTKGDLTIRRQEALIARGHALRLLREHPGTRIIILGDFNDHTRHPNEPEGPIEILTRPRDTTLPLHILNITDNVGDLWTHYYAAQATYDRIDMIIVNKPLREEFLPEHSFIYRQKDGLPHWREASDHRAVRAAFSIK